MCDPDVPFTTINVFSKESGTVTIWLPDIVPVSFIIALLATDVDSYPGFSNPINKIFFDLEREFSGGGMGIQKAIIIKK